MTGGRSGRGGRRKNDVASGAEIAQGFCLPMKAKTLKRTMAKKLSGLGLEIRPASAADRGVTQVADLGATVVNSAQRTVRGLRREAAKVAESARAAVHEATKPKKPR